MQTYVYIYILMNNNLDEIVAIIFNTIDTLPALNSKVYKDIIFNMFY